MSSNLELLEKINSSIESLSLLKKMPNAKRFTNRKDFLRYCCDVSSRDGYVLEFGVFTGTSIRIIAENFFDINIVGFDSFEGLPDNWRPGFSQGAFDLKGQLPIIPPNVTLNQGWFDKTIPEWLKSNKNSISFIHVDCDLYSSSQTILKLLSGKILSGTVIAFDEFFNYPGWQDGEFRAFIEWADENKVSYEYIAVVTNHEQVAVRIL